MGELDFLLGQTVEEFRYPVNGLRVVFEVGDEAEPDLYVDLEGQFTFTSGAGESYLVGEDLSGLGAVFALSGQKVERVSAEDGVLILGFSDGSVIRCEPASEYEAWQVVGGDPYWLVVCACGGELAIWDRRDAPVSMREAGKILRGWGLRLHRGAAKEPPSEE